MSKNFEEKAYCLYEGDDDARIHSVLREFFQELVARKGSNGLDGLQATFVLLPNQFGAKVCEKNGLDYHPQSQVNLIRFLKGRSDFIDSSLLNNCSLWMEEEYELEHNIQSRIVSGDNHFLLAIIGKNVDLTDFQRRVLREIINVCKEISNQHVYHSFKVGLWLNDTLINHDILSERQLNRLYSVIGEPFTR